MGGCAILVWSRFFVHICLFIVKTSVLTKRVPYLFVSYIGHGGWVTTLAVGEEKVGNET